MFMVKEMYKKVLESNLLRQYLVLHITTLIQNLISIVVNNCIIFYFPSKVT